MEVFSPKTVLRNAKNNVKEENPDMLRDVVGFKHHGNLPHLRNPSMVSDAGSSKEANNVREGKICVAIGESENQRKGCVALFSAFLTSPFAFYYHRELHLQLAGGA